MGRLFEKEYCVISELMESPDRPCTFVLGGAKVSDAFLMMETVLNSGAADTVLTGGLVGNILLAAQGDEIGSGSMDACADSLLIHPPAGLLTVVQEKTTYALPHESLSDLVGLCTHIDVVGFDTDACVMAGCRARVSAMTFQGAAQHSQCVEACVRQL